MRTRQKNSFTTIRVEGAILQADLIQRIAANDTKLGGLSPNDYHLFDEKINEATNRSWSRLLGAWASFSSARAKLPEHDNGTTITRERWLMPLFQELGFGRLPMAKAIEMEGKTYPVSHSWQHLPIHLIGCKIELDRRTPGVAGAAQASPHSLIQELLNRSGDYLWALLSNGLRLRILRDNVSLTRQAYVEFDLEAMMQGEIYADFVLLWLLCHESRVEADKPEEFWLEKWSRTAQEQGTRFLEKLRSGVEQSIKAFGSGFLAHSTNKQLRARLQSGELNAQDYYRQLLRLVYRLLFLFVAEDRELLLIPIDDKLSLAEIKIEQEKRQRYLKYYSTVKLRRLAGKRLGTRHSDLWYGLKLIMQKLGNEGCEELLLPALGSFLFSDRAIDDLNHCQIENHHLLAAIRELAYTEDDNKTRRVVDFKNLRSEELGSVYESLLELHPRLTVTTDNPTFDLQTAGGNERKTSGSYYTPESLVQCLLDSALDPVVDEAIKQPNPEQAILNLKVCDPACGSGHFLVAAAHRMAKRLAAIRTGDEEPAPIEVQRALRDVIGRCIYGVDINEMAVELCKVALWMEAIEPGKPLSFLDHHIQCGNSLLGTTQALMDGGVPDEAFNPIEGDDKKKAAALKKQNKREREGKTGSLFSQFDGGNESLQRSLSLKIDQINKISDGSIFGVRSKQELFEQYLKIDYLDARRVADAWCAAFVWKKTEQAPPAVTEDIFWLLKNNPAKVSFETLSEISRLAEQYQFFHWHLAFPDVFHERGSDESLNNQQAGWSGGFDVVLGNPPWERIKVQEKEWFATRKPEIANTANASQRQKMIKELINEDRSLYQEFLESIRQSEGESQFVRESKRFPLCGRGDVNTYSIFTETNRMIVNSIGRVGCIVPSGIATDDTTKIFFRELMESRSLNSLYDFENSTGMFPGVGHGRFKFCLLTFSGIHRPSVSGADFIFFARLVDDLFNRDRHFSLSADDLALLNPNTRTCPIFRNDRDAKITKKVYKSVPILFKESDPAQNYWRVDFQRMFDMTNDSSLFTSTKQLEIEGYILQEGSLRKDIRSYIPLYEAKLFHHYNHRFGDYLYYPEGALTSHLPDVPVDRLQDPFYLIKPRYWINEEEVFHRLESKHKYKWLIAWRDICRNTDERTVIATVLPYSGVGNNAPVILVLEDYIVLTLGLIGCFSSFVLDFIARFKIGGTHLNLFIINQLPIIPPQKYSGEVPWQTNFTLVKWLSSRVLELVYTSWDLEPFAKDCGYDGPPFKWDEERRFLIRCELDAAYFHLYGIERDDVDYIMETFPIVKRKDEAKYNGDYRTKRVILEIYDAMATAIKTNQPYQTIVSPPPADPSIAHPPRATATPTITITPEPAEAVISLTTGTANVLPFRRVNPKYEERYNTCVPLYSLKAAAGEFSDSQSVDPTDWVEIKTSHTLRPGLFVAQVVGKSMEPTIPDGAYCLFAAPVGGTRQGKIVLVEHHAISDPETGGRYTVKRYRSIKETMADGGWQHREIRLEPLNPDYQPIILNHVADEELQVVAEFVEVLS